MKRLDLLSNAGDTKISGKVKINSLENEKENQNFLKIHFKILYN